MVAKMHALAPRPCHWLIPPLLLLASCFSGRTGGSEPGPGPDAGADNISATVTCGDTRCSATTTDARWGGEPCCLEPQTEDGSPCGLQADEPRVSYAGVVVPVSDILQDAKDNGEPIVTTETRVACQPRNQPGVPDERCPTEIIGDAVVDAGSGAGDASVASVDAGMPTMPYVVTGCCRPDGMCGFIDPATDFGCVLISMSLVGQAFGRDDQSCE